MQYPNVTMEGVTVMGMPLRRVEPAIHFPLPGAGACAICGCATEPAFTVHGYCIHRCISCAHEAVEIQPAADHVARIYDDTYFEGGSAGYPDYLAEGNLLR